MIEMTILIYLLRFNFTNGDLYELVNRNTSGYTDFHSSLSAQGLREEVIFNTENFVKYSNFIDETSKAQGIDPDLVRAVIVVESKFNPKAGSHKGAQGLMQLMPGTAREVGVVNRLDPYQSISGGIKYLKKMLKRFDGNVSFALAAYNAGPGKVLKYKGIPPYRETQGYVRKVLFAQEKLRSSVF